MDKSSETRKKVYACLELRCTIEKKQEMSLESQELLDWRGLLNAEKRKGRIGKASLLEPKECNCEIVEEVSLLWGSPSTFFLSPLQSMSASTVACSRAQDLPNINAS